MYDAIRKIRSLDKNVSFEAAAFIAKYGEGPDANNAIMLYLSSDSYSEAPLFQVNPIIEFLYKQKNKLDVAKISRVILAKDHPDYTLQLYAARYLVEIAGIPQNSIGNDRLLDAANLIRNMNAYGDAASMQKLQSDPEMASFAKDMVALNWPSLIKPSEIELYNDLLRAFPEPRDAGTADEVIETLRKSWPGKMAIKYVGDIVSSLYENREKSKIDPRQLGSRLSEFAAMVTNRLNSAVSPKDAADIEEMARNAANGMSHETAKKFAEELSARSLDIGEEIMEKAVLSVASPAESISVFKSNPGKYQDRIAEMITKPSAFQAQAIRELLPLVYYSMDQGIVSNLWEKGNRDVKMAMLDSIGEHWPGNFLANLTNSPDRELASIAVRLLGKKKQPYMVPKHLRDPEL